MVKTKENSNTKEKKKLNLNAKDLRSFSRYLSFLYDTDIDVEKLEYSKRKPGPNDNKNVDLIVDLFITGKDDKNDD